MAAWPRLAELRLDYCRANSIEVVRRASGGGALYLDPGQLGFSLVVRLEDRMPLYFEGAPQHHAQRILVFDEEDRE